ncbi:CpaF family protein [Candidatus Solincola tengchongensis]|uniref:CpaF family protein n=1 Tax=Candidatus Solincola tengchongensis TaxID=2900693 RepID=UPI00257DDF33
MEPADAYPLIRERVRDRLSGTEKVLDLRADIARKRKDLLRLAREVIWEEGFVLGSAEMQEVLQKLLDDILGLGPLESLMRDAEITEVMVNGPHRVYVEKNGVLLPCDVVLQGEEELYRIIDRIIGPLGLHVDEASPYVDARLPDGSRVNVILPPLSLLGPAITIRKFRTQPFTLQELVEVKMLGAEEAAFLAAVVRERKNVVITGGAGSGKTTLLNALSAHIHPGERIITLEDAAELRLQQPHVVPLETRPPNLEGKGEVTLRDLLRNALRMRPDRIIIGEVRGPEALDLLQALNTGHRGSMTTIHANSPLDALSRLETMALTAGVGLPAEALRRQIERAVDVVVHVERDGKGRRRVREIAVMEREEWGGGRLRRLEPEALEAMEKQTGPSHLSGPDISSPTPRKREGVRAAVPGPRRI